jgi:dienelactone hydrolase
VALVAAGCYPAVDEGDAYVAVVYQPEEVTFLEGILFDTAPDDQGEVVELRLDVFHPPLDGRSRPLLVLVHGGGFLFGDRSDFHAEARQWAQRGYVVATPSYRLASSFPPDGFDDPGPALDASADVQVAIKWLRANAGTYDIDTTRVGVVGSSAGGVIALLSGLSTDLTGTRHQGPESHRATAVFSTGAPARALFSEDLIAAANIVAPALVHGFESDTVTGYVGDDVRLTCVVWGAAPSTDRCTPVVSPGAGHTVGLGPTDEIAFGELLPFLAVELDLGTAATP